MAGDPRGGGPGEDEHDVDIFGPEPHVRRAPGDERRRGYTFDAPVDRYAVEPELTDDADDTGPVDEAAPEPATDDPDALDEEAFAEPPPDEDPDAALARVTARLDERWPQRMVPDTTRITALMDVLGQPQRAYPSIHLTGTNGKTSTARMVDALLRALNLRTGRTTSPHLESVTERIALDGEPLSPAAFARAYDDIAPYLHLVDVRHDERLTYHEVLTGMAFAAFADAPVDVAVVEVGMGGTWDATNVLDAPVAVITPISLDHTQWLGRTVAEIATEKAGIVHPGAILIAARQEPEAAEVLVRRVAEVGATIAREGVEFGVLDRQVAVGGQQLRLQGLGGTYDEIYLPLYGVHQAANAAAALAAVEAFVGGGAQQLDADAVRTGFAMADSPGRLEVVRREPTVVLDAAHNVAGARALAAALAEAFAFERLTGVVAVLDDKDARGMLAELEPVLDRVVVTRNSSPRALPVAELAAAARDVFGAARVEESATLAEALDATVDVVAGADAGGVLVTGSVVTVGEARHLL